MALSLPPLVIFQSLGRPRAPNFRFQKVVYFLGDSTSRTCRGKSRRGRIFTNNCLDLFGTLKMTDFIKHYTILMKKSKTHLYIQCNGCKLMAATVVWRYRPRCLEHNFPKSTEKGNHGSFIRKLVADGHLYWHILHVQETLVSMFSLDL